MKNKVWLLTAALLLFTAGCGKPDLAEKRAEAADEQKTTESQETAYTTETGLEIASGDK
ncbi:MAG: hypothetical protein ACLVCH_12275 [Roseburia inulinivorans]